VEGEGTGGEEKGRREVKGGEGKGGDGKGGRGKEGGGEGGARTRQRKFLDPPLTWTDRPGPSLVGGTMALCQDPPPRL